MKYLGIDFGMKRTGIAATDSSGSMAFARRTITRKNRAQFWREMEQLLADEQPDALVVGLPLHADGSDGETALHVRAFVKDLKRRFSGPVFQADEALTSAMARQDMNNVYERTGQAIPRDKLDQQAAVHILDAFLRQPEHSRSLFDECHTAAQPAN